MEYLKNMLLRESVRFIEMCQIYVFKGKISLETYISLSNIKLDFIKDVLVTEKKDMLIDKKFSNRIAKLIKVDNFIYRMHNNAVV
jgi:hypothetical protein